VAHGPQKKPTDFGHNPDHITLRVRVKSRVTVKWESRQTHKILCMDGCVV